ncbi:MAG TPA: hypothetical protein VKE22_20325 [Haliangiales bacterium]|nr:hypothetical protein [Haliangiales bacterium]
MRRAAIPVILVTLAGPAAAQTDGLGPGARAVGRAGAALFGDDAAALWASPASLSRRGEARAVAGAALAADARTVEPGVLARAGAPPAASRAGAGMLPWGGLVAGVGDAVVVGAAVAARARIEVAYPEPGTFATDDRVFYPQRYAGTRLTLARTDAAVGVAVRPLPWLAAGASVGASRVAIEHGLTVWGGDGDAADIGGLDPRLDMALVVAGKSAPVPAATLSAIAAPLDVPLELAASVTFAGATEIQATPSLAASRGAGLVAAAVAPGALARLELPAETIVRGGARLVAGRAAVELDVELHLARGSPAWEMTGVSLVPAGGDAVPLARVPVGAEIGDTVAVRGAAEVSLGLVTLSAGYAHAGGNGATPVWPGGASHTLAAGVEARAGGATVILGVAHAFRPSATTDLAVVAPRRPALALAASPGPASGGTTWVALDVAVELR